jgi:hypothetical protein
MTTGEDGEVLRENIARALFRYRNLEGQWDELSDMSKEHGLNEADRVLALIWTKIEDAYREGWIDGYHNGRGGSVIDHMPDWLESDARATISPKSEKQDG